MNHIFVAFFKQIGGLEGEQDFKLEILQRGTTLFCALTCYEK